MEKKSSKGLHRDAIDKYYTKESVVNECIETVKKHINISKESDLLIEPSAGNGAFMKDMRSVATHCIFYDLVPEHPDIIQQDFLEWDSSEVETKFENIHILGNPPFGRQSSTAIKFIKKACSFAKSISFILPKSFKKESMQKKFDDSFHLLYETDLPKHSFLVESIEHDVPCIFQIWIKKDVHRKTAEKREPVHFEFVKKGDNPDISVRRVGVYAGKIDNRIEDKSEQSHYFIRFTNGKTVEENTKLLQGIVFHHNNTVGPRSISKPELIIEFNQKLQ